ncbi:MAG: response regulator receiver protein, partial [uncultured bacterium]
MIIPAPKSILLVEDDFALALVTSEILKDFGFIVITAHTGEEAVKIALSNEKISLILMDINLGDGIDGPEAARQILHKRNIPIVFLTSHSEKEYVDRVKKITRYGYVIKNSGDFVLH